MTEGGSGDFCTEPSAGANDSAVGAPARRASGERVAAEYEAHYGRLRDQIDRRIGDLHTAEDLAQEVFIDHIERPDRYDPRRGPLGAWLATIGRNRSIDRLRRARLARPEEPATLARSFERTGQEPEPDPSDWLQTRDLHMYLQRLTHLQRRVVMLRYWHHYKTDEIAAHLRISEASVRNHHHRALRFLESRLAPRRGHDTGVSRRPMSLLRRPSPVIRARRSCLAYRG